jgi:RimJ/RimL family protein N-acetyltransferase
LRWVGIFRRVGLAPDARHESLDELFDRQLALTEIGERTRASYRRAGVLADGRIIGAFNLNAISRGLEFQAEASWWVATPWAGKGLGTQGVRRLLDAAFAEPSAGGLGLHKVLANIQPDNVACLRIAAKIGFRRVTGVATNIPVGDIVTPHELYLRSVLDE